MNRRALAIAAPPLERTQSEGQIGWERTAGGLGHRFGAMREGNVATKLGAETGRVRHPCRKDTKKLVTHHGVFAPAFPLRDTVVPPPPVEEATPKPHNERSDAQRACPHPSSAPTSTPAPAAPDVSGTLPKKTKPRPRYPWADLLRRVYLVDVLTCPNCKGVRRLLAFTHRD